MKILVTGGAGFIGSTTVDLLIKEGHDVVILDNISSGKEANINKAAKLCKRDISDKKVVEIFKREDIDCVIHQAAQVMVKKSLKDPVFDAQVNILGSLNLLEACKESVGKIIYASSGGAVYGEPEYLPVDEKHPIKPLSPYGASKYIVEKYIEIYSSVYGIDYSILRYGNVYGPRQDPHGEGGVVSIFAYKMLNNLSPVIFGDGRQTRDFVYVEDAARANISSIKHGKNVICNIGSGTEKSVNEVVDVIRKTLKSEVQPKFSP
ncbi:MAG: NAD-dependent epimerase/dehydratase family protein, partial [Candidatus Hydrothermarchaeaceae archaeon]